MKKILVVDDDRALLTLLTTFIKDSMPDTVVVSLDNGEAFKKEMDTFKPDVALLDVKLPDANGVELCKELKHVCPASDVILMTGYPELSDAVDAVKSGAADFIIKPFEPSFLIKRITELLKNKRTYQEGLLIELRQNIYGKLLSDTLDALKETYLSLLSIKPIGLKKHTDQVFTISMQIGSSMKLSEIQLNVLHYASIFHDIGKLAVPDAILLKVSPLTEKEISAIRMHSVYGDQILREQRSSAGIAPIVRSHHEWINGNGYPDHLSGMNIPIQARIISVADAYDAMRSERVYRQKKTKDQALRELNEFANIQFDPEIVPVCCKLIKDGIIKDTPYTEKESFL